MKVLTFCDARNGDELFSQWCGVVPRVDDEIIYEFDPIDRERWSEDAAEANDAASGGTWIVTRVSHLLRTLSISGPDRGQFQLIRIYLQPIKGQ